MRRSERIVLLVSGLGAAQSVAVVTLIGAIGGAVGGTAFAGGSAAALVLDLLSAVFLVVAITVTAVVVSGAAEIVLTGRLREIALRRLLGASAAGEQQRAQRLVLRRAGVGMACGTVLGYGVSVAVLFAAQSTTSTLHLTGTELVPSPLSAIALVAQFVITRTAVRRGTRVVLDVQPVEALQVSAEADRSVRPTLAVAGRASTPTLATGVVLLAVALAVSPMTPLAMVPALLGGVTSFVGLVSCGHRLVPPLVRGIGRLLPASLPVTLARRTLLRHPARTSRAVLGVAATVTLITTFTVGIASFDSAVRHHYDGSSVSGLAGDVLAGVVTVFVVLTGFLGATAAVALTNAVAFSTWLRRRETALLRILGQSARDTRRTVLAQSLLLALTAMLLGLALGGLYGWIGAQSVFGATEGGHLVVPVVPIPLVLGAALAVGVLSAAAALLPIRASLRQAPIEAYSAG